MTPHYTRLMRHRTVVTVILCAIAMPLAFAHVGRVPWLLLAVGLATYGAYRIMRRLPPGYRAQGVAALFVVAFYACSALTSVRPDTMGSVKLADTTGLYAGLTEGLLHGRLGLSVEPDKSLLLSKKPYAIPRSFPFVWDASYFAGRYYLYFGPTPVLTLYLPFRLITHRPLPTQFALATFLAAGFVGSLFLLDRARRECGIPRQSEAVQVISTLLLGFASMSPVILRRPSVYEVAIASAYCFSMWGFYFLLGQIRRTSQWGAPAGALIASLLLGLSAGSRATFIATGALLLLVFFVQARCYWKTEKYAVFYRAVPLIGPFAVCLLLLGLYNKVRFGSWVEFGFRYQLNHIDLMNMKFSRHNLLHGISYYLFSSPTYADQFPGIHVMQTSHPFNFGEHATIHEGALGLFSTMPVNVILAGTPLIAWCRKNVRFGWIATTLVGHATLMLLAVSHAGVSPRYEMDFVPAILLVSILTFYTTQLRSMRCVGSLTEVLWIPAACYSIVIGILASISDHATPDSLNSYFPAIYALLRQVLWRF